MPTFREKAEDTTQIIHRKAQEMSKDIPKRFDGTVYSGHSIGLPHSPVGVPKGIPKVKYVSAVKKPKELPPLAMPGENLPRAVYYGADLGGCNAWRMGFPAFLMNYGHKAIINELSSMVIDPRFYVGLSSVTLQRQASDLQKAFVHLMKDGARDLGLKVIYEIDDLVFMEDIPDFNRCKFAFEDKTIRDNIEEMMQMADEITVTCDFMKEYYKSKTSNPYVTVVPNYIPKFWFDGFYDEEKIYKKYEQNKERPVILYAGSGTHFDVANKTNQKDDFSHVVDAIIKARKKYKFVFMGGFPYAVKPFIDSGEMEQRPWVQLMDLARGMHSVGANCTYAALQDNNFNRAKSDIKLLEAGALGLPCVAQDMCTYSKADLKFSNGSDLIDQFDMLFSNADTYMKYVRSSRAYTDTMWLENDENLMKRFEVTFYKIGDPRRKYILDTNPEQRRLQ